jgi:hypothetical protein
MLRRGHGHGRGHEGWEEMAMPSMAKEARIWEVISRWRFSGSWNTVQASAVSPGLRPVPLAPRTFTHKKRSAGAGWLS